MNHCCQQWATAVSQARVRRTCLLIASVYEKAGLINQCAGFTAVDHNEGGLTSEVGGHFTRTMGIKSGGEGVENVRRLFCVQGPRWVW